MKTFLIRSVIVIAIAVAILLAFQSNGVGQVCEAAGSAAGSPCPTPGPTLSTAPRPDIGSPELPQTGVSALLAYLGYVAACFGAGWLIIKYGDRLSS